jgi:hypothetical protein
MNSSEEQNVKKRACLMRIINMVALVLIGILVCIGLNYVMDNNRMGVASSTILQMPETAPNMTPTFTLPPPSIIGGFINLEIDALASASEGYVPNFPTM